MISGALYTGLGLASPQIICQMSEEPMENKGPVVLSHSQDGQGQPAGLSIKMPEFKSPLRAEICVEDSCSIFASNQLSYILKSLHSHSCPSSLKQTIPPALGQISDPSYELTNSDIPVLEIIPNFYFNSVLRVQFQFYSSILVLKIIPISVLTQVLK